MLSGYARENGIYARHNRMAPISTYPYTFLLHHFSHQVVDNSAYAHILICISSTLFPRYQNSIQYCAWGPMASPSMCDHSPEHTIASVYNSAFLANCQFREKEIDTSHK